MADEEKEQPTDAASGAPEEQAAESAPEAPAPAEEKPAEAQPEAAPAAEEKPAEAKAEEKPAEAKSAEAKPAAEGEEGAAAPKAPPRRKGKNVKHVPLGIAHIKSTFNNTQVTITDMKGDVVSWGSAGRSGFKGSRKSTAYAATVVAQEAGKTAMMHGMQELEVRVQGPGAGRESAIRALQSVGFTINAIKDVTPIPHNGCRPRKRRRV